ncbi:SICA antigen [Plasmodium coatneyi]|uniref:SICA antigen n=1 Tax=Plasmodium coatneyi TaxID=208452 RepID=A0A1B1E2J7_9APIC|nr:SICA antigen [Plasmodium coatneyi]ANQ09233.1 SICA antigen [Plasmodium coatneyi]
MSEVIEMFKVYSRKKDEEQDTLYGHLYVLCDNNNIVGSYELYEGCVDEEFCKVLIRNWNIATKKNIDCAGKCGKDGKWKEIQPDAKCKIFNLWLAYYGMNVNSVLLESLYINEAMKSFWESSFTDGDKECNWESAKKVLSAKNMEEVREVFRHIQNEGGEGEMRKISQRRKEDQFLGKCKLNEGGKKESMGTYGNEIIQQINEEKEFIDSKKKELDQIKQKEEQQQLMAAPPPQAGGAANACSSEFKTHLNAVADKWFQLRGKNKKNTGHMSDFWNDVDTDGKNLLEKILKENQEADQYCNGNDDRQSGPLNEKERAACKLVAGGLHHIYSIQLKYQQGKQDNPVENQKFQQLVACMMLNVLVKKLEEEEKSSCSVKEGIKHAFSKSEQIKGDTNCKDYKNNECDLCKEEDYSECTIEGTKVKTKLDAILEQKNDKIQQALSTINTLCHRVQCATTKWFGNRTHNKDQAGWVSFIDLRIRQKHGND